MLLRCVKKWDFICHILESGVSHCLSGVQISRVQVERHQACLLSDIIRNNLDRYQKVFCGGRELTEMKSWLMQVFNGRKFSARFHDDL